MALSFFVDTETGACTNLIENKWWCIKRLLPLMHSKLKNFGSILLNICTETSTFRSIYLGGFFRIAPEQISSKFVFILYFSFSMTKIGLLIIQNGGLKNYFVYFIFYNSICIIQNSFKPCDFL